MLGRDPALWSHVPLNCIGLPCFLVILENSVFLSLRFHLCEMEISILQRGHKDNDLYQTNLNRLIKQLSCPFSQDTTPNKPHVGSLLCALTSPCTSLCRDTNPLLSNYGFVFMCLSCTLCYELPEDRECLVFGIPSAQYYSWHKMSEWTKE